MNAGIVERFKLVLLQVGATPVLYLMIALCFLGILVSVERALFFFRVREDVRALASGLSAALDRGQFEQARQMVSSSISVEAAVVAAGLLRLERGVAAVEEAMAGACVLQRQRLERRLSFLSTLGANAPFVGLLGTVIGIVQAFESLERASAGGAGATAGVMGAIAEALVATAIGLVVAIPAVAAFNAFQRRIKTTLGNADALRHMLLSYVKAVDSKDYVEASARTTAEVEAVVADGEPVELRRVGVELG